MEVRVKWKDGMALLGRTVPPVSVFASDSRAWGQSRRALGVVR